MDAQFAWLLIGLSVGVLVGAVAVFAAWQAETDDRRRAAAMARHPAGKDLGFLDERCEVWHG